MKALKPLALGVAVAALGAAGPVAADVYGLSSMDIDNLVIQLVDEQGQQIPGAIPGNFTFTVAASAGLNGSTTGSGDVQCSQATCPNATPVLASGLEYIQGAGAPGAAAVAAGPLLTPIGDAAEYARAESEILAAQLVGGTPTDTEQIAEASIIPGDQASASTRISSNTSLEFIFEVRNDADLAISFSAIWETFAEIQNLTFPGDTAIVNADKNVEFTLTNTASFDKFTWLIDGNETCGVTDFGPNDGLSCVVSEDGSLTDDVNFSNANTSLDLGGSGDFSALFENVYAGTWTLLLTSEGGVSMSQTRVPEPATLLLLSGGLAGIGALSRRRKKRIS